MSQLDVPTRWLPFLVLGAAFVIFWGRRPDLLLHAQFWAEDGAIWYSQAWNDGALRALLLPHTGYFQTVSRLTLGAATALPMEWAPAFSNGVALLFRSAVVAFLTTSRMAWAPLNGRLLMALYLMLMPVWEVHANITNTHWYLGLYLAMIMVAEPGRHLAWRLHDIFIILLAGLSGPFGILVAPVIAIRLWSGRKEKWTQNWPLYAAWFVTAIIQAGAIVLFGQQDRVASHTGLGATVPMFSQIIGSHLVAGSVVPGRWVGQLARLEVWMTITSIAAAAVVLYAWISASWQLRGIMLFGAAVLFAGLASPVHSQTEPQWLSFLVGAGERYFIIPRVALMAAVLFALSRVQPLARRKKLNRLVGVVVIGALVPGVIVDPLPDMDWLGSVKRYQQAAPGTIVSMPTPPIGSWAAHLER